MIPGISDPRWKQLVKGEKEYAFSGFAVKMLMGKIRIKIQLDSSEGSVQESIKEAHEFFSENEELIESDIELIFGE